LPLVSQWSTTERLNSGRYRFRLDDPLELVSWVITWFSQTQVFVSSFSGEGLGYSEWVPLETILHELEPQTPRSTPVLPPTYVPPPTPVIPWQNIEDPPAKKNFLGVGVVVIVAVVGLALLFLLFAALSNDSSQPRADGAPKAAASASRIPLSERCKGLKYEDSYFDVIRALGQQDKEIEEREAQIPNIVLGYISDKIPPAQSSAGY
jgi:hypothetical protein